MTRLREAEVALFQASYEHHMGDTGQAFRTLTEALNALLQYLKEQEEARHG